MIYSGVKKAIGHGGLGRSTTLNRNSYHSNAMPKDKAVGGVRQPPRSELQSLNGIPKAIPTEK